MIMESKGMVQISNTPALTGLLQDILANPVDPLPRLALADYYQEQDGLSQTERELIDVLRREGHFVLFPSPKKELRNNPWDWSYEITVGIKHWELLYRTRKVKHQKTQTIAIVEFDLETRNILPYCHGIAALPTLPRIRIQHQDKEIAAKLGHFPRWYCHTCYSSLCDERAKEEKKRKKDRERDQQRLSFSRKFKGEA